MKTMRISSVITTTEMALLTAEQSFYFKKLYENTKYNRNAKYFSRKVLKLQSICAQHNFGKRKKIPKRRNESKPQQRQFWQEVEPFELQEISTLLEICSLTQLLVATPCNFPYKL